MKVLINVVHPAQVLDTKNVYLKLRKKGHQVKYAARDREVILSLLDSFSAEYVIISKKSSYKKEMFIMLFGLLKLVLTFKPNFIIAVGGSMAPFVGWLTRTKNIHWSDSENSLMMNFLSHPWSTKSLTSKTYRLGFAFSSFLKNKRILHNSLFQLAYCGPGYFEPSAGFKRKLGIEESTPLYFMRLGKDDSYHDINVPRPTIKQLVELADFLSSKGHLEISFEGTPPPKLARFQMTQPPWTMQQYIYHADLVFSQGACTASESAVLGTPCIFQSHLDWGYIEDEIAAGILFRTDSKNILSVCQDHLQHKKNPTFHQNVQQFLKNKEDIVELTVRAIEDEEIWKIKKTIDPTQPPFSYDIQFPPSKNIG